ncbi:hypothetical protein ACEWY4_000510 [Coilia grayii]|uniref:DNA topoisomerase (ATP-hydrolyzing) n=1 Tax=Coilia grayii TaxID=363190 RepID=A0ABD1KWU2_9TELE
MGNRQKGLGVGPQSREQNREQSRAEEREGAKGPLAEANPPHLHWSPTSPPQLFPSLPVTPQPFPLAQHKHSSRDKRMTGCTLSPQQFLEVDRLRYELLENINAVDSASKLTKEDSVCSQDVLTRIEGVVLDIVTSLSRKEAPVLVLQNRNSWSNVSFDSAVGLHMSSDVSVSTLRSDCASSVSRFALILKVLSTIYKLVQSNSYATKRDIYYNDTQLFRSQKTVDAIVDDISCMLRVPRRNLHVLATSKGFISGDLCYLEEDGTRIDCSSSSTAVPVSSNVCGIKNILSSAKFVLIIEKDATFQRLLDDDFCTKLSPCIMITGKGIPDVNSRLMVRKLWDTLHVPIFALVDGDPHGIEIMCIYKYGSVSMSFEAHNLTVPSVLWLGLLPSDIERLRVPQEALIPLTPRDERKLQSLKSRPYLAYQPEWKREMEIMERLKHKAEIQSLTSIASDFLTRVYLPNKLRYGGWVVSEEDSAKKSKKRLRKEAKRLKHEIADQEKDFELICEERANGGEKAKGGYDKPNEVPITPKPAIYPSTNWKKYLSQVSAKAKLVLDADKRRQLEPDVRHLLEEERRKLLLDWFRRRQAAAEMAHAEEEMASKLTDDAEDLSAALQLLFQEIERWDYNPTLPAEKAGRGQTQQLHNGDRERPVSHLKPHQNQQQQYQRWDKKAPQQHWRPRELTPAEREQRREERRQKQASLGNSQRDGAALCRTAFRAATQAADSCRGNSSQATRRILRQ